MWFKSPYNNRHPKLKGPTQVRTSKGDVSLPAGTVVQPIRRKHLPYGCWAEDLIWSETEHVACHLEPHGIILVEVSAVDFSK